MSAPMHLDSDFQTEVILNDEPPPSGDTRSDIGNVAVERLRDRQLEPALYLPANVSFDVVPTNEWLIKDSDPTATLVYPLADSLILQITNSDPCPPRLTSATLTNTGPAWRFVIIVDDLEDEVVCAAGVVEGATNVFRRTVRLVPNFDNEPVTLGEYNIAELMKIAAANGVLFYESQRGMSQTGNPPAPGTGGLFDFANAIPLLRADAVAVE